MPPTRSIRYAPWLSKTEETRVVKLKGIWRCSHCGNLESTEREVLCWECGKGQMLFYSGDDLAAVFNSHNVVPLNTAKAE